MLLSQDLPFFIIRLLILVYYSNLQSNYTLYFFVAKSLILVIFELYYIVAIITENQKEEKRDIRKNSTEIDDIQMTKF